MRILHAEKRKECLKYTFFLYGVKKENIRYCFGQEEFETVGTWRSLNSLEIVGGYVLFSLVKYKFLIYIAEYLFNICGIEEIF